MIQAAGGSAFVLGHSSGAVLALRAAAAGGDKVLRWFENEIVADDGTVVARSRKQIYVRRKR